MGVYTRPDSPYYWLWLETASSGAQREKTSIVIGKTTVQKRESRQIADELYFDRMRELAKGVHRLHVERPQIRFAKYAEWYVTHKIAHRASARRESEMLKNLRAFFEDDLLAAIDMHRVAEYHTARAGKAAARTINREVDLLKGMLRDACPKYLERSPILGMKRLRIVPPRRRYVTVEEFDQLLAVCEDGQDTAILVLGRDGLARLGDLLDLQHADRDDRMMYIRDPKGGESYEMALSDRALTAVEALAKNESTYLFPKFRRAENPRDWPGSVRQRLEYLCRQANIPYGRTNNGVTFHWGTRRSGATDYLMTHKKALKGVQAQGNWKKPDVLLDIYTEVTRQDKLEVVGATPVRTRKRRRA